MAAVGRRHAILGALPRAQLLLPHEPRDAIAGRRAAVERHGDARTAVGCRDFAQTPPGSVRRRTVFSRCRGPGSLTALTPVVVAAASTPAALHTTRSPCSSPLICSIRAYLSAAVRRGCPAIFLRLHAAPSSLAFSSRKRRFSASSCSTVRTVLRPLCYRWPHAPRGPSDTATAGGSPARLPPSRRCDHCAATTPTLPACTAHQSGSFRSLFAPGSSYGLLSSL